MIDILRPKYQAALEEAKATSTNDIKRGVGVSIGVYGCGLDGPDASEVAVELNPDNTVTIYACWQDHGQGADMGVLGTAHQALRPLGLSPDQIRLVLNDTALAPNSGPSGGSRSQVMTGQAIRVGCETLIEAMRKTDAAPIVPVKRWFPRAIPLKYAGQWTAPATNCDENAKGRLSRSTMYGVFMAQVAVETATGKQPWRK